MTVTDATVTRVPVHPPGRFRQGSGRLCLDFLRTLRYRNTPEVREELVDEEALAAWVEQCGPFGAGPLPPPSPEELGDARAVREAGYALILAALGPEGPAGLSEAARVRLNSAAGYPPPTPRLAPSGELGWHADHPVLATVALVARDALDLAASPALLPRLRPCASPACGASSSTAPAPAPGAGVRWSPAATGRRRRGSGRGREPQPANGPSDGRWLHAKVLMIASKSSVTARVKGLTGSPSPAVEKLTVNQRPSSPGTGST